MGAPDEFGAEIRRLSDRGERQATRVAELRRRVERRRTVRWRVRVLLSDLRHHPAPASVVRRGLVKIARFPLHLATRLRLAVVTRT